MINQSILASALAVARQKLGFGAGNVGLKVEGRVALKEFGSRAKELKPGDEVVFPRYGFAVFALATQAAVLHWLPKG